MCRFTSLRLIGQYNLAWSRGRFPCLGINTTLPHKSPPRVGYVSPIKTSSRKTDQLIEDVIQAVLNKGWKVWSPPGALKGAKKFTAHLTFSGSKIVPIGWTHVCSVTELATEPWKWTWGKRSLQSWVKDPFFLLRSPIPLDDHTLWSLQCYHSSCTTP